MDYVIALPAATSGKPRRGVYASCHNRYLQLQF